MAWSWFGKKNNNDLVNTPATTKDSLTAKEIESDSYAMYRLISQLRDTSQSREYKYAEYDVMSADVIIKTALCMYADDSTQVDENSNTILSVDSSDQSLKRDLTAVLNKFKVEDRLNDTAYALGKYGNKYWKIYLNDKGNDIDHIEEIDDPGCVLDLYYQGEPTYFAESTDDTHLYKNSSELNLYDHNAFVHFHIHSADASDIVELPDQTHRDKNGDPIIIKYKILEGESLIESVRAIWRILRSLEDSLLAARLAKADYVRVFNIEVGQAGTTETRLIVNKVKKLFDSSVSMNIRDGTYSATKTGRAWADPIFNSVSDGKGAIDVNSIGGDFEVKSIVDIDYFNNLLFAGLRIPKTLMGFEESLSGGLSSESTLVQLDIRYGKYIKKIIDAIVLGATEFCNIWLKVHNRSNQIGKFKIVYNSPSTSEEFAKLQELSKRVEIVLGLIQGIGAVSENIDQLELLKVLLDEFLPYQVFIDKISPILEKAKKSSNNLGSLDSDTDQMDKAIDNLRQGNQLNNNSTRYSTSMSTPNQDPLHVSSNVTSSSSFTPFS